MARSCHWSAITASIMTVLLLACAIATITTVIFAHVSPTPGRDCYRPCVEGDSRVCYFEFNVEPYQTMSRACSNCPFNASDCSLPNCIPADGVTRKILVVNKEMPGPPIQVCLGDVIVVKVKNSLHSDSFTIHWHGLTMTPTSTATPTNPPTYTPDYAYKDDYEDKGRHHSYPVGTPFMDGVPGVTQCPIPPKSFFTYTFDASNSGTHFYHAHSGFHRGDGIFGALIVRQPPQQEINRHMYDYDLPEHTMLIHDWLHIPSEDKFLFRHHSGGDDFPKSMLVNGQGPYQHASPGSPASSIPYKRFKVIPGSRYLFRLISNAVLNCPIIFSVEDHNLTVIASDGNPLTPVNATSLVVYAGERWDVVLHADPTKTGLFWMSFIGGVDCEPTEAHQFALLEYQQPSTKKYFDEGLPEAPEYNLQRVLERKPMYTLVPPLGVQVNSINSACTPDLMCAAALRSPHPMPPQALNPSADVTLYLAFEMNRLNNIRYYSEDLYNFDLMVEEQQIPTPQINNLSMALPATPLLLGGYLPGRECTAEAPSELESCQGEHCLCLHMYRIPLGATVDMVFIDEGQHGDENHPIHMHGEYFWVLGQDRPNDVPDAFITRAQVIEMDRQGLIERNLNNPPYKDTVTIPDGGYSVVRFIANNPGYWLLHCHLLFHSAEGMDLVIKIGEDNEIPRPPKNFPTCGNYRGIEL